MNRWRQLKLSIKYPVSLNHTLNNGQCYMFRSMPNLDTYAGVIGRKCFEFKESANGEILYRKVGDLDQENVKTSALLSDNQENLIKSSKINTGRKDSLLISSFMTMDLDYSPIFDVTIKRDPLIQQRIEVGRNIRLLRVDPWEAIITFICSQYNTILRTKKMTEKLCSRYGKFICEYNDERFYSFPNPTVLASLDKVDLDYLGFGYRSPYVIGAAKKVELEGGFDTLLSLRQNTKYSELVDYFRGYAGIGFKVSDCIILFGLSNLDAIPIDTHMFLYIRTRHDHTTKSYKKARDLYIDLYGDRMPGLIHNIVYTYELRRFAKMLAHN